MPEIVEKLRSVDGADARVISSLDSLDFTIEYARDDVETQYSDSELEEAYRLAISNQVTGDDFKNLIGRGRYDAQTLFFEDIVVFVLPATRYEAVFASFDRHDAFPVNEVVDVATGTEF